MKNWAKVVAAAVAVGAMTAGAQTVLLPGQGVANTPADGVNAVNVAFVPRGAGNPYGWGTGPQFITPFGLTLLPWSFPNELSFVYGLRANLGFGRYEGTYGADVGAWSASGEFGGIGCNVVGNFVERDGSGLQVGLVNLVRGSFSGIQVGVMNQTASLRGMQVGLMNFNATGIFFPVLNFGF